MTRSDPVQRATGALLTQLWWFIRLRWGAAGAIIAGSLLDHFWLHWFERDFRMLTVGLVIAGYNVLLLWLTSGAAHSRRRGALLAVSWTQIVLDLACLALLTLWTGGVASPLLGFFVFHMVFASLLLPSVMAYGGAAVAVMLLCLGLRFTGRWPTRLEPSLYLAGWVLTLLLTVYLANRITRSLRRQRQRLLGQNRRIRQMAQRLQRQQQAMIQHEKMVAMGHMAAGIVHEIANPLANMDSLLQLVERKPERFSPQTIASLRQQIQRINQIIRQMSEFAHPTQTTGQVVGLNDAVEQALRMLRFDRRLERVAVERDLSADAGAVHIQPHALQQALINLVINAVDAMSQSSQPVLQINTRRDGDWCSVAIRDNGHGIQPEHLSSLFEPFFTTKPVGWGTGLGLSISYRLIASQGGNIMVDSQPDQGATFTIRLPRLPNPPQEREKLAPGIPNSEKKSV